VAIARAIISKPSFLILDEASSAIDQETEKIIYENIKKYLPNTIVILINHRKGSEIFTNKQIHL
ncbi:MAG: ABC transporter ATP-binding protein/permease, partial [Candidatus Sericytochromatia bacterium]